MVANLSSLKHGWDAKGEQFSIAAEKRQELKGALLHMVDDTIAGNLPGEEQYES
jgi:hypothetical protein